MKRFATIACGGILAVGILSGCGSDGDSDTNAGESTGGGNGGGDYCGLIEDAKSQVAGLGGADATLTDISAAVDRIGEIADSAPDDIAAEWESMHSAGSDMVSALEDAGIPPDVPMSKAAQKLAKKDPAKAQEMMGAFSAMKDVQPDAKAVQKHAQKECGIQMGSS